MLDEFDPLDSLVPQKELILPMSETFDELLLTASLDLSKHFAAISLDLPTIYTFVNFKEFCHAVINNKVHLLHLLACIVDYNIVIYNKVLAKYSK